MTNGQKKGNVFIKGKYSYRQKYVQDNRPDGNALSIKSAITSRSAKNIIIRGIYMTVESKKDGGNLTIALTGRLDTVTAPQLDDELKKYLDETSELDFDFAKLEYISSAGLRVLLSAQKTMNRKQGRVIMRNVNESIKEVFDMTGFSGILTIE